MSATPLIEVDQLSRDYGSLRAVDNLSFSICQGEAVGFLGPNGAGKSTTLRLLTGNLAPSSGTIRIAGHDLLEAPIAARGSLGYLPEQPPLYPDLSVDEQLSYAARLHGVGRRELPAALSRARSRCELDDVAGRLIGNLSKGYQQRVGIAQAIIHNPRVVLLDEPTVGLDPHQVQAIRTLIRELAEDHSVLLSSHILAEVQASCDRVLILRRGQLLLDDTIDHLQQRLHQGHLLLALRRPPPLAQLQLLPGVLKVEALEAGRFRLHHAQHEALAEQIAATCAAQDWGLHELTPERGTLEQLFLELTSGGESA